MIADLICDWLVTEKRSNQSVHNNISFNVMARTFKDQRKFIAKQMIRTALPFCIAKMKSNGQWESLERFPSYDDADERIDYWCDRYPFAFVDIIRVEELNKVAA